MEDAAGQERYFRQNGQDSHKKGIKGRVKTI